MVALIFLLMILILGFNILYFKKIYSPAIMFSLLWTGIMMMYHFHFFGLYYAEDIVQLYIFLGTLMFSIGCILASNFSIKQTMNIEYMFGNKLFCVLNLLMILILVYGVITNVSILMSNSLSVLELRYGPESGMNDNGLYVILRDFFAVPMVYVNICVILSKLCSGETGMNSVIYLIGIVFLEFLALFEQACIYALIIAIGFLVLIYWQNIQESIVARKYGKYIKWCILGVIIIVIIMIDMRGTSILKSIYEYTTGCVVCFSEKYQQLQSEVGVYAENTYGLSSLLGLARPIDAILERLGIDWKMFDKASNFYWPYLGVPISISDTTHDYNSFVTMFMYLYKDAGVFGIVFGSLLFGIVCQKLYKKFIWNPSTYNLSIYFYIAIAIFLTYSQSPFTSHKFALAIIYFIILRRRERWY